MKINTSSFLYILTYLLLTTVVSDTLAQAPVRDANSDISQRLARIEQLLNNQGLLDMLSQLESLQRELNQLRGQIEVQNRNIEELRRRQRILYTDLDQRIQGMQQNSPTDLTSMQMDQGSGEANPPLQTLSPVYSENDTLNTQTAENTLNVEMLSVPSPQQQLSTTMPASPGAASVTGPTTMVAPDVENLTIEPADIDPVQVQTDYQQAFNLLKQSQYDMAIQSFRAFLANYPVSNYSDNAQYWLGEAFYVMRQFEPALAEYNKLITQYPQSQKYTHALLKIGYSYHELGQPEEAKKYLTLLTQKYPGTTASRLAEERLKAIAISEQQAINSTPVQ